MTKSIPHIIKENQRRLDFLFAPYDPIFGVNSLIPRFPFYFTAAQTKPVLIPESMKDEPIIRDIVDGGYKSAEAFALEKGFELEAFQNNLTVIRLKHDFEFAAYTCITVEDKLSGKLVNLRLRYAQRRILAELERQRLSGKPVRLNIPKSRQFGSTTFCQAYMFWIQNFVMDNWHSATAAHLDDAAKNMRGMYDLMAKYYPADLGTISLVPYMKSTKTQKVKETGSIVGIGSSQSPDNLRGYSFKVLHLSEVAYYVSTDKKKPEDLARTLASTVPLEKNTIIIRESTCNGTGNYWHRVCLSSHNKTSNYGLIFIPFFEIEIYHQEIDDKTAFIKGMKEYDWELWEKGATLESIKWYNEYMKTEEYDEWRMKSEYPSDFLEAFQGSGRPVFPKKYVHQCRKANRPPIFKGEIHANADSGPEALKNIELHPNDKGNLYLWAFPEKLDGVKILNRYCVSMDIGGTTKEADYSVIRVMDRFWMSEEGGIPEIVATWRGHIDQDLLAWKAIQICKLFDDALFVPEANSLRNKDDNTEGSHFLTVLDEIIDHYENIFCRTNIEQIRQGMPRLYGFHTNRSTKTMIINCLKAAIRDSEYFEADARACDEMDQYEYKKDDTMGAVDSKNDDILMATAILVWCALKYMPPVREVELRTQKGVRRRTVGESSF